MLVVETVKNLTGGNPGAVVPIDAVVRALPGQQEGVVRLFIEGAITAGWLRSVPPDHVRLGDVAAPPS